MPAGPKPQFLSFQYAVRTLDQNFGRRGVPQLGSGRSEAGTWTIWPSRRMTKGVPLLFLNAMSRLRVSSKPAMSRWASSLDSGGMGVGFEEVPGLAFKDKRIRGIAVRNQEKRIRRVVHQNPRINHRHVSMKEVVQAMLKSPHDDLRGDVMPAFCHSLLTRWMANSVDFMAKKIRLTWYPSWCARRMRFS